METTKMKIEYRKLTDNESDPWLLLTNIDELIWNGVYALRVIDDDGSLGLPFRFENDDTVTLVLKDHAHEGKLQNSRTIVQTITRVERSTGKVFTYTRARYCVEGVHRWNDWEVAQESEGNLAVDSAWLQQIETNKVNISNEVQRATEAEGLLSDRIKELEDNPNTTGGTSQIPKATATSLGGVIIGSGLDVDENGTVSISDNAIDEDKLSSEINNRIDEITKKVSLADALVVNDGVVVHFGALIEGADPYTGTKYSAYTEKILANGETLTVGSGYKILSYKFMNEEQELFYETNLDKTFFVLAEKGMYYQFEFCKENNTSFTENDLQKVVKSFVRNPITWSANCNVDTFITSGYYNLSGSRSNEYDGLPISDTGKFNARLSVLTSDDIVTQVLTLLNADKGSVYIRTKHGGVWQQWRELLSEIPDKSITENKLADDINNNLANINNKISLVDALVINDGVVVHFGALIENSDPYTGTKYTAYTDKIYSNGETITVNSGYKILSYKFMNEEQELFYETNINGTSLTLAEKGMLYQIEFGKENNTTFTEYDLQQVVKSFIRTPITWDANKNLNTFVAPGNYNISGSRSNSSDGLPTTDTGKFSAQLAVLVSGNNVMQKLMLLSATSGAGNVYMRTKQGTTWGTWKTLF